jgi:nucleotide-binding universal stress UspA family protein
MEIRDILVSADPSESGRERLRFAIRLAARFKAHLTGYYTGPTVGLLPGGPAFEIVKEMHGRFADDAANAGVSSDWQVSGEPLIDDLLASIRVKDLAILGLGPPTGPEEDLQGFRIEQVVTAAGRPVLGIPVSALPDVFPDRVLVAWDGSREAARALHDALPLIGAATTVTVVSLGKRGAELAQRAIDHLARHGIKAVFDGRTLDYDVVGDEILQRAAMLDADLLVAGAYGHPRFMERVLGGVSDRFGRQMLTSVLMSH